MSKLNTSQRIKLNKPIEVYATSNKSWIWLVMKHYQKPENEVKNPYARVMCRVLSPIVGYDRGELGDVYLKDIMAIDTEVLKVYDEKDGKEFNLKELLGK